MLLPFMSWPIKSSVSVNFYDHNSMNGRNKSLEGMHNLRWAADGAPAPENTMQWSGCAVGFN